MWGGLAISITIIAIIKLLPCLLSTKLGLISSVSCLPAGGDQGLLNLYWSEWATKDIKYHLPFIFNVVPNVTYGYAPAYQRWVGKSAVALSWETDFENLVFLVFSKSWEGETGNEASLMRYLLASANTET